MGTGVQQPHASPKRLARTAGVFYLCLLMFSGFAELYVRSGVRVSGDAAATAGNLAANVMLFRLGFVSDLVGITSYLLVAMTLYLLLKHVDRHVAAAMVIFVALAVAVMSANMLNHFGALMVATDPSYATAFGSEGSEGLAMMLLELHAGGYGIAQVFFGLWLLPLGYLAYRSGYFPRPLGILLMVGSASWQAELVLGALVPGVTPLVSELVKAPANVAEFWMIAYLLFKGVRTARPGDRMAVAP